VCLVVLLFVAGAEAQNVGSVTGTVTDSRLGTALPGAQVRLVGTRLTAITGSRGFYRIADVPPGEYEVKASYLGFDPASTKVTVVAGETATADLQLPLSGFEDQVTVVAPILEGRAKSLNQQKNAPNIKNVVSGDQIGDFPDPNAAEAVQRIPGVTIERDQGEGRYVLVRGTEPRLNAMEINGQRIPSPEGEIRSVALDVIPADLLETIEVSKTLTPDMDGDSIGGTVNLVTAQAPEKERFFVTAAGGYNNVESGGGSGRITGLWARRFSEQKAGLVLSGSYFNTDRGSENFEVAYDDGALDELQQRDYTVNRERWGLNAAFDYRLPNDGIFYVRGIYNNFADQEYRRRVRNRVGDDRIERELKDRLETQEIVAGSVGGRNTLGNGLWTVDYEAAVAYANEDEPDARYTTFRQKGVEFAPNVSPSSIDPDNIQANPLNEDHAAFEFDEHSADHNFTSDRDLVGQVNLTRTLSGASFFKVGAKYKNKNKKRDNNTTVYGSEDDLLLSDFADPDFDPGKQIIDGRYTMGPFVGAQQGRSLPGLDGGEIDYEQDAADFDATENTFGTFAMAELNYGNLLVLPGLRYERTSVDYTGYQVLFDEEGDYASTSPVDGTNDYDILMPHLHLRYRLGANGRTNLRAAFTRTLARPNYYDLVPYRLILREDQEISLGNADLQPTRSWNFDLLVEHFLPRVGVLSGGFFYKDLQDYIYVFNYDEERDGETFDVTQPLNGENASLTGFEVELQSLRLLGGFGLLGNYTYTDSEAQFPDREGEKASLPGQSRHVGNVAVVFEQAGFSGRVALNFHGKFLAEVGGTAAEDIYYDNHKQLDLAASYKLGGTGLRLYMELNNLTNEPLRYYEGTEDRPIQEEYYSWWGAFGIKWDF
jgi:TonB-dependent receptor